MQQLLTHINRVLKETGWEIYQKSDTDLKYIKKINNGSKQPGLYTILISAGTKCFHFTILFEQSNKLNEVYDMVKSGRYERMTTKEFQEYDPLIHPIFMSEIYSIDFFNAMIRNFQGRFFE